MGDKNVNLIGDPTKHDKEQVEGTSTKIAETNGQNRVEFPTQTREESMDPMESWDSTSMDSRNDFANVKEYRCSNQNGVKDDDGELSGSMYVQTMDTLGTTSKGLNNQQLLQDNGLSKGINLMVDLNISQGRIEGLNRSYSFLRICSVLALQEDHKAPNYLLYLVTGVE
ncbi:hypothetical protein RHGRI_009821 [Rhododendron griersonianum]|uniref:Uncharacterized protein n=1 Tax=Rhododendron griersonianum TaxID=479676 RepID=A0AAV6KGV8_9ERIC|nr:hypothetical protein RHGRI_009821 [Rhododendron griersonianum]